MIISISSMSNNPCISNNPNLLSTHNWPASSAACTSRGTSRTCPPRPWWPADQSPRTGSRRRRRPAPGSRGTACWAAGPGCGDTPGARSGSTYPGIIIASQYWHLASYISPCHRCRDTVVSSSWWHRPVPCSFLISWPSCSDPPAGPILYRWHS